LLLLLLLLLLCFYFPLSFFLPLKHDFNTLFISFFYQAYQCYSEALEIDPDNEATNSKLYSNRATVGSRLGKYQESIEDCNKALELEPAFFKVYLRRADLYMKTEDYEKAVFDYEKAKELEPGNRGFFLFSPEKN